MFNVDWCVQGPACLPAALWSEIASSSHHLPVPLRQWCLAVRIVSCDTYFLFSVAHKDLKCLLLKIPELKKHCLELYICWSIIAAVEGLNCLCILYVLATDSLVSLAEYLFPEGVKFSNLCQASLTQRFSSASPRGIPSAHKTVWLCTRKHKRGTCGSRELNILAFICQPKLFGGWLNPDSPKDYCKD